MSVPKDKLIREMNQLGKENIPFVFMIDFLSEEPALMREDEAEKEGLLFEMRGISNHTALKQSKEHLQFEKYPVSFEDYCGGFATVKKNISLGNTYLLNYTQPTKIKTNYTLKELYASANSKYKALWKDKFTFFSPEIFAEINDGIICSYPMKGTINADVPDAEAVIMADKKESAEHNTIVDLIRNDLNIVAGNVRVEKFRYTDKIITNQKALLQVSSKIAGDLARDYNERIGDIISALLPAGSVTGAPKEKTVEIILETENYNRGFYTGIFGRFDGKNLDSCVMIRFIEKTSDGMIFKSGGGITMFSEPEKEYNEMIDKVYVPVA